MKRLIYQPSISLPQQPGQIALPIQTAVQRDGFTLAQIQQGFAARLREVRREEILRGVTAIGPHRDELRVQCNGIDLTDFGSRGQVRTAILSLKLAEVDWLKQMTGEWPVLLMDETLAELDTQRRKCLLTTENVNGDPYHEGYEFSRWLQQKLPGGSQGNMNANRLIGLKGISLAGDAPHIAGGAILYKQNVLPNAEVMGVTCFISRQNAWFFRVSLLNGPFLFAQDSSPHQPRQRYSNRSHRTQREHRTSYFSRAPCCPTFPTPDQISL